MLFSYDDCIERYKNDYGVKKAIRNGYVNKLEKGIYSESEYISEREIISYKYPNAVFTLNSALYYHDLTDVVPEKYYLATDKDSSKISDSRVKQIFENDDYYLLGAEKILTDDGSELLMYNRERLLVEVIRYHTKMPYDFYKEVINSYRNIIHELDIQTLQEYISVLPKSEFVTDVLEKEIL